MSDILVIGGTGNMGRPLVKSLVEGGHRVSVVCRRNVSEEDNTYLANAGGMYLYGDAKDRQFMSNVLSRHFDAIVDFCIYSSEEFRKRMDAFLDKTDQYVCLSTAAVYADIPTPKNESSPRYMESDPPKAGTAKWSWYCYEKARIEDMLHKSGKSNWTIVRPGVTMNSNHVGWGLWWNDQWLGRIIRGQKVVVEKDILDFKFSLSSGAQVALLIGSIVGNEKALGEVFNVCSSEVWSWKELLDKYKSLLSKCGYRLNIAYVNSQDVIKANLGSEYVYTRARLLDRVFDNAKIVSLNSSLSWGKSMAELLEEWTRNYIQGYKRPIASQDGQLNQMVAMDKLTGACSSRCDFQSLRLYIKYLLMRYFPWGITLYSRILGLGRSAIRYLYLRQQ